jgi:hypothetical protein
LALEQLGTGQFMSIMKKLNIMTRLLKLFNGRKRSAVATDNSINQGHPATLQLGMNDLPDEILRATIGWIDLKEADTIKNLGSTSKRLHRLVEETKLAARLIDAIKSSGNLAEHGATKGAYDIARVNTKYFKACLTLKCIPGIPQEILPDDLRTECFDEIVQALHGQYKHIPPDGLLGRIYASLPKADRNPNRLNKMLQLVGVAVSPQDSKDQAIYQRIQSEVITGDFDIRDRFSLYTTDNGYILQQGHIRHLVPQDSGLAPVLTERLLLTEHAKADREAVDSNFVEQKNSRDNSDSGFHDNENRALRFIKHTRTFSRDKWGEILRLFPDAKSSFKMLSKLSGEQVFPKYSNSARYFSSVQGTEASAVTNDFNIGPWTNLLLPKPSLYNSKGKKVADGLRQQRLQQEFAKRIEPKFLTPTEPQERLKARQGKENLRESLFVEEDTGKGYNRLPGDNRQTNNVEQATAGPSNLSHPVYEGHFPAKNPASKFPYTR